MYDVSGLYLLQQSLVIRSYVKILVRGVLSERYTITQEQIQYQPVEILIMLRACTLIECNFLSSNSSRKVRIPF